MKKRSRKQAFLGVYPLRELTYQATLPSRQPKKTSQTFFLLRMDGFWPRWNREFCSKKSLHRCFCWNFLRVSLGWSWTFFWKKNVVGFVCVFVWLIVFVCFLLGKKFGEEILGTLFARNRWVSQARRSSLMQALTQRKANRNGFRRVFLSERSKVGKKWETSKGEKGSGQLHSEWFKIVGCNNFGTSQLIFGTTYLKKSNTSNQPLSPNLEPFNKSSEQWKKWPLVV